MKIYKKIPYKTILITLSLTVLFFKLSTHTNFVSHSDEPQVGDKVKNNNPSCKHYKSVGTVTRINTLKNDKGKTITYEVENDGETYCVGQSLTKTMDQLTKY